MRMVSFLKKLKGQGINSDQKKKHPAEEGGEFDNAKKLEVDVFQSSSEIVIYAPIQGSRIDDIDVAIEGDNDVVTIRGKRTRPEGAAFAGKDVPKGKFYAEENDWGEFYRQIILPDEINVERSEAKLKNGILILLLPLIRAHNDSKTKINIKELEDE